MNEDECDVYRKSTNPKKISVEDLVVGDVFSFFTGMKMPADGLVIEGDNIQCDESALSGEPKPEEKGVLDKNTMLKGVKATLFAQTNVVMGSGKAIVTAVGVNTKAGQL